MNLAELQAELRHFTAERDWQPFHTPKNLTHRLDDRSGRTVRGIPVDDS
ncbi:MAG: hypothetical protein V9G29_15365 [Burkholderiaceae bacterium]